MALYVSECHVSYVGLHLQLIHCVYGRADHRAWSDYVSCLLFIVELDGCVWPMHVVEHILDLVLRFDLAINSTGPASLDYY